MNALGKLLVMMQTVLSLCAMAWAITNFVVAKDYGWEKPAKEVLEYKQDGTEKSWVWHASEYDKSEAALREAKRTRDQLFVHVTPALESLRENEPYLPLNHLFYVAKLKEMRDSPDAKIDIIRYRDGGLVPETPVVGKPELEAKPIPGVNKSYKSYYADLKKLLGEVDPKALKITKYTRWSPKDGWTMGEVDPASIKTTAGECDKIAEEIRKIVNDTKAITAKLTGTDEADKYVEPGVYKLIDLEFQAQVQLKREIDEIKPNWSKAIEQARLFVNRRANLEATLDKLKAALPKDKKK